LKALDKAEDTLTPGDVVRGIAFKNNSGELWIYIPCLDRFIWFGRKVTEYHETNFR
jgi:hypothetical protein